MMFFDSWMGLLRVLVVGTLAYVALVFMLRVSGKRTLSKMNAFDMVVTVALGSTFATVLLSSSVALAEGVLALGLLVFLQYAITWLSVRYGFVQRLVKSEPTLLVRDGIYLDQAMRTQRVTRAEVSSAVREVGEEDVAAASMVVLETDGTMSVVLKSDTA